MIRHCYLERGLTTSLVELFSISGATLSRAVTARRYGTSERAERQPGDYAIIRQRSRREVFSSRGVFSTSSSSRSGSSGNRETGEKQRVFHIYERFIVRLIGDGDELVSLVQTLRSDRKRAMHPNERIFLCQLKNLSPGRVLGPETTSTNSGESESALRAKREQKISGHRHDPFQWDGCRRDCASRALSSRLTR